MNTSVKAGEFSLIQTSQATGGVDDFISAASFWSPETMVESAWHQHAPFAFWLVGALRPRLFVELGAHNGFSYLSLCQAAERLGLDAKGYAIDTWQGDDHAGFYGDDVYAKLRERHDKRYGGFSLLIRSSFDEALPQFAANSIDLLHIDGRHYYDDVKHDFDSWKDKLSGRAIVLFHDTNVRERGFGVYRLWDELRAQYPAFEFLHGHGLGVLGVGAALPEGLTRLFAAAADPLLSVRIQELYARLGAAIEGSFLLARQGTTLGQLEEELARRSPQGERAEHRLLEQTAYISELEQAAVERLQEIAMLKAESARRDTERDPATGRTPASDPAHEIERLSASWQSENEERRRTERDFAEAKAQLGAIGRKVIHSPRDFSRRWRKSWQKWRGAHSPGVAATNGTAYDFGQLRDARYRKYLTSRLFLRLESVLSRSFAVRMRNRMAKHASAATAQGAVSRALFDQLFAATKSSSEDYVPYREHASDQVSRINAIAFYLPQFHPIAENDQWWGKGFTEWTNVSKAVPQFAGHYQPRLPGELGFYDLRLPEVMKRQIELARNYGINGFCFHYYWFTGRKRLLERPLNQFLDDPSLDFPFCVCWANENWSRRWDGSDQEILMEQRHEPQDDLEFIEDLSPFLKDPRYIRVDGRPLIIVYRVDIIPDARKAAEIWRNYCIKHGIGDPWLVAAQSFGIGDPRKYGFDAAVEFPPHDIKADRITELSYYNPAFEGQVRSYESVVSHQIQFSWPEYNLYKSIIPAWDNEARRPGRGRILWGSAPFLYKKWLASICQATDARHVADDEKLVFINAWNEWAEGAYLEPDRRFGYAYLEATQQILSQFPQAVNAQLSPSQWLDRKPSVKNNDTAVILHLFYEDLWPEISRMLKNLGHAFDLYVSVPAAVDAAIVLRDFPNATLVRTRNRGRDIAPFLEVLRAVVPLGYSQICKIHSKKSLQITDGGDWRAALLTSVLGSEPRVDAILKIFRDNQDVGMVGAAEHFISTHSFMGANESNIESLRNALDLKGNTGEFGFFAGSMFWFRPEALTLLSDNLTLSDFDRERGQTDGTLAHALERLFTSVCRASGYEIVVIDEFGNQRTVAQHAEGELLSSTASYNFVPPTR